MQKPKQRSHVDFTKTHNIILHQIHWLDSLFIPSVAPAKLSWQLGYGHVFMCLTDCRTCYAMNRFLYILIAFASWWKTIRLQICSPGGLISPLISVAVIQSFALLASRIHDHEKATVLLCCYTTTVYWSRPLMWAGTIGHEKRKNCWNVGLLFQGDLVKYAANDAEPYFFLFSALTFCTETDPAIFYSSGSQTISCWGPPNWHLSARGPPFEKICQRPSYKRRCLQL